MFQDRSGIFYVFSFYIMESNTRSVVKHFGHIIPYEWGTSIETVIIIVCESGSHCYFLCHHILFRPNSCSDGEANFFPCAISTSEWFSSRDNCGWKISFLQLCRMVIVVNHSIRITVCWIGIELGASYRLSIDCSPGSTISRLQAVILCQH